MARPPINSKNRVTIVRKPNNGKFGAWFLGLALLVAPFAVNMVIDSKPDKPQEPQKHEMKIAADEIAKPAAVKKLVQETVREKAAVPAKAPAVKPASAPVQTPPAVEAPAEESSDWSFFGLFAPAQERAVESASEQPREEFIPARAARSEIAMIGSLRVGEEERRQERLRIRSAKPETLMVGLKEDVHPLETKGGAKLFDAEGKEIQREGKYWSREVRSGVFLAKKKGVWETTLRVCEALNFSADDALALALFESGLSRDGLNKASGADGLYQILDDPFIEMFARYGKMAAPVIREIDPDTYRKMEPLIGLVKMSGKGSTSDFEYDKKACLGYFGKNAAKWSQAQIENEVRKRILSLRKLSHKNGSTEDVVSTTFGLFDLSFKVPENRRGLACFPRLVHNYGQRGGNAIADAFLNDPDQSMYDVMMGVYKTTIADKGKRKAHVLKLLYDNGLRTRDNKADTNITAGTFVGRMERSWKIATNCFAQWREKMEIAEGLNQFLLESNAPLRVVWDPGEKFLFSLERAPESGALRTSARPVGAGPSVKATVYAKS